MRFLDKVTIVVGGGRDDRGDPIPEFKYGPYRATMTPVKSSESLAETGNALSSFYRLLIDKTAAEHIASNGSIEWRGRRWAIQGDVEQQIIPGGRLHHLAATVKVGP